MRHPRLTEATTMFRFNRRPTDPTRARRIAARVASARERALVLHGYRGRIL
jgi:hypothetical protein